jgi:hypothetical protein
MPKPQPVLYDWGQVAYQETVPNNTGSSDFDFFLVNDDGTYEDQTLQNGVVTTETGTITKKELKQLDKLVDQINRDPYDPSQSIQTPDDDPVSAHYLTIGTQQPVNGGPAERHDIYHDQFGDGVETYRGANDQTDVQEYDALLAYMQALDARYGSDLA